MLIPVDTVAARVGVGLFIFAKPLTPMRDQDRILQYQYNIKQTSDENKENY